MGYPSPHSPSQAVPSSNRKILNRQASSGLQRRRTLFLMRHGEATLNLKEAEMQERVERMAERMDLEPEEIEVQLERARRQLMKDPALRNAPLTERGKKNIQKTGRQLQFMVEQGLVSPPTEALISPLSRTLETCKIMLESLPTDVKAHIQDKSESDVDLESVQGPQFVRYSQTKGKELVKRPDQVPNKVVEDEAKHLQCKNHLKENVSGLVDVLLQLEQRHVLIVSHQEYLQELERELFRIDDSPAYDHAELRVYRVLFTPGDRTLDAIERVHV